MRKRNTELLGLGHPLVDALISYLKRASWKGDVALLSSTGPGSYLSARWLVIAEMDNGKSRQFYLNTVASGTHDLDHPSERADLEALTTTSHQAGQTPLSPSFLNQARRMAEASVKDHVGRTRAELDGVRGFRIELVGLSLV